MIKHVKSKKVKNCENNIDYEGYLKRTKVFSQF